MPFFVRSSLLLIKFLLPIKKKKKKWSYEDTKRIITHDLKLFYFRTLLDLEVYWIGCLFHRVNLYI